MQTITDRILKSELVEWKKFKFLQSDKFKDLSPAAHTKLRQSILQNNFVESFKIWEDKGQIYCLDGYHRCKVLRELESERHKIPEKFRADFVDCENRKEAAKLVLIYSSIYAHPTEEGVFDFMSSFDLTLEDMKDTVDIPEFNLEEFESNYFKPNELHEDVAPEPPGEPQTKKGDLYEFGGHRLLCGDCTSTDDVKKLMGNEQATLGFTSPPYWCGKDYETQKSMVEVDEFIRNVCISYALAIRKDCSRIVINTGTGFISAVEKNAKRQTLLLIDKWCNSFYELGWNLRHIRHWLKTEGLSSISARNDIIDQHNEFFGTFEQNDGEPLPYDTLDDSDVKILEVFYNKQGKQRGSEKVWRGWAMQCTWSDIRGNATLTGHVASFPVEVPARHLMLYTRRGESVLDLMVGSGTTIIAAEELGRRAFGMELDPRYCDVTIQRWINLTGIEKVKRNGEEIAWLKQE